MKRVFGKLNKAILPFLAILLSAMLILALLPTDLTVAYAADAPYYPAFSEDPYSNQVVRYELNNQCKGYYMTPKAAGKYRTLVMIHGQGGVGSFRVRLWAPINKWVKEGYFPPMVVVMPEVQDLTDNGMSLNIIDFQDFINKGFDKRFNTLLSNIENGALSSQIGTDKPIYVGGFSMGGFAAVYAGDEYNTRLKNVGGLSPSASFYLGDGKWGVRNYATDIHFASDALVYLSAGLCEESGKFVETINRYANAIAVNNPNVVTKYEAPVAWGGHDWPLCQKEIFMYLYYNIYGEIPSESLVESAVQGITTRDPAVVYTEETHTGSYEEPAGPNEGQTNPDPVDPPAPYDGTKLISLDFSKYVSDTSTQTGTSNSIGSVTNNGSRGTSTRVVMSNRTSTYTNQNLAKEVFTNGDGGTTSYLHYSQNDQLEGAANTRRFIEDNILETQANTISFWVKTGMPSKERRNIMDYYVTYGDAGSSVLRLCVDKASTLPLYDGWNSASMADIDNTKDTWANYTIVNPAYSNGSKTVKVYVNGAEKMSKTFSKPSGTLSSAKLAFGGCANQVSTIFYPEDISFGDVIVYDGAMSASEVVSAYNDSKSRFTVSGTPALQDITGYTFSNSSVTYDGANHTIKVAAGSNATQGVSIAYTSNGSAFSGATQPGTYPVTATITKSGYNTLTLNATLKINSATISGYSFANSTVTYDGQKHMINVSQASNATQGVSIAYTSNGSAFSGATQPGTYPVTATITKSGYNTLTLNATLTIEAPAADVAYKVNGIKSGDRIAVSKSGTTVQRIYVVNEDASGLAPAAALGLASADFYIDGALSGTAANSPCYYDLPITSGSHTLKVVAHKAGGGETVIGTYNYSAVTLENTSDSIIENFDGGSEGADVSFGTMNIASTESCKYQKAPGTGSLAMTFTYDGTNESGASNIFLKNIPVPDSKIMTFEYDFYSADSSGNMISHQLRNPGGSAVVSGYTFGTLGSSKYDKNTWHHVSYVFDFESHTFRGYLDGYEIERGTLNDTEKAHARFYLTRYSRGTLYVDNMKFCGKTDNVPKTITGYTFSDSTVTYDGTNHMINVSAGSNATQGVTTTYTCNGSAFSGATQPGTYNVTATIKKSGYNDLVLNATLTIEPAQVQPIDNGEVLVELDLASFAPSYQAGASGIVNKGKSTTATLDVYSTDAVELTTDYIYDKDNLSSSKKVVRLTHSDLDTVIGAKQLSKHFELSDPAFEEQDITLSFWTNVDPISKQTGASAYTSIVQYNAKRDDGTYRNQADGTSSRARLWQATLDTSDYYYWGNAWGHEITINKSKQWHHVVMTIPKFRGGAKTVNIYVDGKLGLTQEVNLGGHALDSSFISFGSDENKAYVSTDISFADIKVYAGAMSENGIQNLYNSEKDVYDNMAYNKITVSKDGSVINKLTNLEAGDKITINYDENVSAATRMYAVCYDADGALLSANSVATNGTGSFKLSIPDGFEIVRIYTWNGLTLSPIQKVTTLYR